MTHQVVNGVREYYIKELDVDIIEPTTANFERPESTGSKVTVIGKPGCFKQDTKIMMFDGTLKNVQDVELGDIIMGDDSTPRTVLDLCRGEAEMYEIIPTKGESYTVNGEHELCLTCTGYNSHPKGEKIRIKVTDFLQKSRTFQTRYKGYRTGVNFPAQEVTLDPYILGCWLGDGDTKAPVITNLDAEIVNYFREKYEKVKTRYLDKQGRPTAYRISNLKRGPNSLAQELKKYGVFGNKHIPHVYKANSEEVRLQVLAGLLDTDGYYDKRSNVFEITLKIERLLDDLISVVRSLGLAAYKTACQKKCTNSPNPDHVGTYYRCHISGDIHRIPCKLPLKMAKMREQCKDVLVTGLTIQPAGVDNYYGFTLDGNNLFLLGDYTVVKNTGKTTLIKSLLYEKSHIFPVGAVYSGTEDSNGYYQKIFPSTFVFNQYSHDTFLDYVKRQKIAKRHLPNPWSVILWDDCTEDEKIFHHKLVKSAYKNGRHWKMLHILSLQYSLDIKPVIRTNIDGTFILRETNLQNRRRLYENYAAAIPDFMTFCDIMDQVTNDYTALYIHNRVQSNNFEDVVYYYRARDDIPEDWTFGCSEYWDFHSQRFNPDYVDPIVTGN